MSGYGNRKKIAARSEMKNLIGFAFVIALVVSVQNRFDYSMLTLAGIFCGLIFAQILAMLAAGAMEMHITKGR